MKTLKEILAEIDAAAIKDNDDEATTSKKILTCGATHIAQDSDGAVFAFRGKPTATRFEDMAEWFGGDEGEAVLFCADLEKPEDWTQCLWELP